MARPNAPIAILCLAASMGGLVPASAPAQVARIHITAITTEFPTATAGQTTRYTVRMNVSNGSVSPATITLNTSSTFLTFSGTPGWQFTVAPQLAGGGNTIPPGGDDDVVFTVTRTGTTTGVIRIGGTVSGTVLLVPVSDTVADAGSIEVQSAPTLRYVAGSLRPDTVDRGQQVAFVIDVSNPAGAATAVLDPSQTTIAFATFSARLTSPTSVPGGRSTSLAFTPTLVSPSIALGAHPVSVTLDYEHNRNPGSVTIDPIGDDVTVRAAGGGASIQIVSITPERPTATAGQTTPYAIRMRVSNDGPVPVDVTLETSGTNLVFSSPAGWQYTIAPQLAGGGTTLSPGERDDVVFTVTRTGTATGVTTIGGNVAGVAPGPEPVSDTITNAGSIEVQNTPALRYVAGSLHPRIVTRGQQVSFVIDVSNPAGAATAELDPAQTRLSFSTYTATLNAGSETSLAGGRTTSILFNARPVDESIPLGSHPVTVDMAYTHNGNAGTIRFDPIDDAVDVQMGGGGTSQFYIESTLSNAPSRPGGVSYVNTNQSFDVAVEVQNDGPALEDVRVSLRAEPTATIFAPANPVRNIAAGDSSSWVFNVRAPSTPVQIQTFTAVIDTARLAGSGQGVQAATPIDDTEFAVVQTPTRLDISFEITNPPSARDGTMSTGQLFDVTARVRNLGQAAIDPASRAEVTLALAGAFRFEPAQNATRPFTIDAPLVWSVRAPTAPVSDQVIRANISAIPNDANTRAQAQVAKLEASVSIDVVSAAVGVRDVSAARGIVGRAVPGGTKDVDAFALELAYLAGEGEESDARIDTVFVTVVDDHGRRIADPASVLARLHARLDGGVATAPTLTRNPVAIPMSSLGPALIAPNQSVTLTLGVDLLANPASSPIRLSLARGRDLIVRNVVSRQVLAVVDGATGEPIAGFVSPPLTILSDRFAEYAHNYPNPFAAGSRTTRIAYLLEGDADVSIAVYALDGALVYERSLAAGSAGATPGPQEVEWDGRNMRGDVVRNGVYVCVLRAGSKKATFKIAVAK